MKKSLLLLLILSLIACTQDVAKKEKELKVKEGANLMIEARNFLAKENITAPGGVMVKDENGMEVSTTPPKGIYKNYKISGNPDLPGGDIAITLIVE